MLWVKSFVDNSRAFVNFSNMIKEDNISSELKDIYLNSAKIIFDYMEFDLVNGYKIAHKLNISKYQYLKVVYKILEHTPYE